MNKQKKHTPGPWRVEMNGNYMRLYMPEPGLKGDVARGYVGEANARLIAAAPELLAALRLVLAHDGVLTGADWTAIRAAIARAEGGAA